MYFKSLDLYKFELDSLSKVSKVVEDLDPNLRLNYIANPKENTVSEQ